MVSASRGARAVGSLSPVERLARLLGVVPWVVEQGGAHVSEIAARFDYPEDQVVKDLTEVLFFVGVHPFTPDALIEVDIADEIVDIRYADWFSRPLKLSAEDASRLLTAGRTVLQMSTSQTGGGFADADDDSASPLVRALSKLSLSLGDGAGDPGEQIDVCLGDAPAELLENLRGAAARRRQVEIEYYSLGRDEMTSRSVDPSRVASHDGCWYLFGWCHRAAAERVFRVDRIRSLKVTDRPVTVDLAAESEPTPEVAEHACTVTLRLEQSAAWAADYYPTLRRCELTDKRVEADFGVANKAWLERLLLQLGPDAEFVECLGGDEVGIGAGLRAAAATRVLERYHR